MDTKHEGSHLIARFTRYLHRVAINARYDKIRQSQRDKTDLFVYIDDLDGSESFEEVRDRVLPSERDFRFRNRFYDDAYDALGAKAKQVLRLTFVYGLPDKEISELLHCSAGYVRNLRYRAVKRLRELIERGEIEL